MNYSPWILTVAATGLLIAGEALALLTGMHFLSPASNPWLSPKNDFLLATDLAAGMGLVWLALFRSGRHPLLLFCLAAVALLTHGYRLWEYLAHSPNPFCANFPLFTVNNIKLLGLLLIVILALAH